jgi:DUF4097 and DUF4098 domain-containing protein YvlB
MAGVMVAVLLGWALADIGTLAAEANQSKTFSVRPGGTLLVEADRGGVEIATGDGEEVKVEVERTTPGLSESAAQKTLQEHEVSLEQTGDRVEVRAGFKTQQWFGSERNKLRVHYRITVPMRFNLDVATSAGTIACGDIEGTVRARTAGGSLKFEQVTGPFNGHTSAGNIYAKRITGGANLKTSGGSITIGELGADATVETSAGNIKIDKALAEVKAKTSGGSVTIGEVVGRTAVSTSAGSIRIKTAHAPLEAVTSGGGIEIAEADDVIQARTSAGNIEVGFGAVPKGDSKLSTSGGGIQVRLPEGAGFDVDAKTSGGRVQCRLPMTITTSTRRKDVLEGQIHGGGKALVLRTSAGNITIE